MLGFVPPLIARPAPFPFPPSRSGSLTYSDCLTLARQANSFLLKGVPGELG